MIEIEINKENLKKLFDNLRKEDLSELVEIYKTNIEKKFIKDVLSQKEIYFIAKDINTPLAIGGVVPDKKNKDIGKIWLISTKYLNENKKDAFKYIKNKLNLFKNKYKVLYNLIFKSNFSILNWLKKEGFKANDTILADYKIFYYKGGNIDL